MAMTEPDQRHIWTRSFDGRFRLRHTPDHAAPVAATVSFDRWDPTSLDVQLVFPAESRSLIHEILRVSGGDIVEVVPVNKAMPTVELIGTRGGFLSDHKGTIRTDSLRVGLGSGSEAHDRTTHVRVQMQPSGILAPHEGVEHHFTGEIKVTPWDEAAAIVRTKFGSLEVRRAYHYSSGERHGDRVTHQIERACIMGEVACPAGTSFHSLHEELSQDFDDICILLSLTYRQPVQYYQVEYDHFGEEHQHGLVRHRWHRIRPTLNEPELIGQRQLVRGGLQALLDNFRSTAEQRTVRRAITFLAASYSASLESAYFMAFSALETVANAALPADARLVVPSSQWKKIERKLTASVQDIGQEFNLSEAVVQSMRDKLPELKRPVLGLRVKKACAAHDVSTERLWPDLSFEDGVARAIAVRNDLFHAANALSASVLYGDLVRVQTLCERILLGVLHWPNDKRFELCDELLARVNC